MPPLRASSAAIIQSLRAVPGGLTCLVTGERRPSKFICVPSRSPKAAAGSTMVASLTVLFGKASMAMMLVPTARASSMSCLPGKSRTGSAPRHTSTAISPAAALAMMPAVRLPASAGTLPQMLRYQLPSPSRGVRPGSKPGARPISSAPCTLPRLSAGKKRACGYASAIWAATEAITSGDSAREVRPKMTVRGDLSLPPPVASEPSLLPSSEFAFASALASPAFSFNSSLSAAMSLTEAMPSFPSSGVPEARA